VVQSDKTTWLDFGGDLILIWIEGPKFTAVQCISMGEQYFSSICQMAPLSRHRWNKTGTSLRMFRVLLVTTIIVEKIITVTKNNEKGHSCQEWQCLMDKNEKKTERETHEWHENCLAAGKHILHKSCRKFPKKNSGSFTRRPVDSYSEDSKSQEFVQISIGVGSGATKLRTSSRMSSEHTT